MVVTYAYESSGANETWFAVFESGDVTFAKDEPVHKIKLPLGLFCDVISAYDPSALNLANWN